MKTDLKYPSSKAFTMLELIFVIVVVGILSFVAASSFQRNTLIEATDQVISHIRYTQHLAMMDDKFTPSNANWIRGRWKIAFDVNNSYAISSDKNFNNALDTTEYAKDPIDTNRNLNGVTNENLNLPKKYGVTRDTVNSTCGNTLFFDYLGRPMKASTTTYAQADMIQGSCTIVFTNGVDTRTIRIQGETGYARAE